MKKGNKNAMQDKDRKDNSICVRISSHEKKIINEIAKRSGKKASELLLDKVRDIIEDNEKHVHKSSFKKWAKGLTEDRFIE